MRTFWPRVSVLSATVIGAGWDHCRDAHLLAARFGALRDGDHPPSERRARVKRYTLSITFPTCNVGNMTSAQRMCLEPFWAGRRCDQFDQFCR
jgi:hypothetical protein